MSKEGCSEKITGGLFKCTPSRFIIYGSACMGFCLTLLLSSCQFAKEDTDDRQVVKSTESMMGEMAKAEKLDADGHYEVARAVLEASYKKSQDERVLRKWLDLDKVLLGGLNRKSTNSRLTPYAPPKKIDLTPEDYKNLDNYVKANTGGMLPKPLRNIVVWIGKGRAKEIKSTWEPLIPVVEEETARVVIDQYDILKHSQDKLKLLIADTIIKAPASMTDQLNLFLKDQKDFCQKVRRSRINYVSYDIVSPYLARTGQLIFFSEQGGGDPEMRIYGHDEGSLRDAVKTMTMGCGTDLMLTSNSDVRDQFLDTYSRVKKLAGTAELEELKVLGNFADSISGKSSKGNDLWWP